MPEMPDKTLVDEQMVLVLRSWDQPGNEEVGGTEVSGVVEKFSNPV